MFCTAIHQFPTAIVLCFVYGITLVIRVLCLTDFFSAFDDSDRITNTRRRRGFTDGDRIYIHRHHNHSQQQQQPVVRGHMMSGDPLCHYCC